MPTSPSTESPQSKSDSPRPDAPSVIEANWSSSNDLRPQPDSTPPNPPPPQCQPGSGGLQPAVSDMMETNWFSCDDLGKPGPAYPTMQVSRPELRGRVFSSQTPIHEYWYESYDQQRSAASATGNHSKQPPQYDIDWVQSNWPSFNAVYLANRY
jgi:hypothetical protein